MSETNNNKVVLITGFPDTGKSFTMFNMEDQSSSIYINADNKPLPFNGNFKASLSINDAKEALNIVNAANESDSVDTIILDTISKLMETYERQYVIGDTRAYGAASQEYTQYYGDIIHSMKAGGKNAVVFGHVKETVKELPDETLEVSTKVPMRGKLGSGGIESDFSIILSSRKKKLEDLKEFEGELLTITEQEKIQGFKYVLQTQSDVTTMGDIIRSPWKMWSPNEKFIDNNLDFIFKRINEYYG